MFKIRKANEPPRWVELSGDCKRDLRAGKVGYHFTIRVTRKTIPLSRIELAEPMPILTAAGEMINRHFTNVMVTNTCGAIAFKSFVIMPDHLHLCFWVDKPLKFTVLQLLTKGLIFADKALRENHGLALEWQKPGHLFICYSWKRFIEKIEYDNANVERWKMDHSLPFLSHPHIIKGHPKLDSQYQWQGYGELALLNRELMFPCYISHSAPDGDVEKYVRLAVYLARNGWVLVGGFISPRERELWRAIREIKTAKIIHVAATRLEDKKVPAKLAANLYSRRFLRITSAGEITNCTRTLCVRNNLWIEKLCGNWRDKVISHFREIGSDEAKMAALGAFLKRWKSPGGSMAQAIDSYRA